MIEILSIVISGRNQRVPLEALLRQLQSLECAKELIYIDLNSTDDSLSRAALYVDRLYSTQNERAHELQNWAFGIGCNHAEYDWVLTLDASSHLSEEMVQYLQNGQYRQASSRTGVISSRIISDGHLLEGPPSVHLWFRWPQLGRSCYEGMLWRKECALEAGNWNPALKVSGAYDLLFRVMVLGYKWEQLDFVGVEIPDRQDEGKIWFYQGTHRMFWQPMMQGRWLQWFRTHPWWMPSVLTSSFLVFQTEIWAPLLWIALHIAMLFFYGPRQFVAQAMRWFYWWIPTTTWRWIEYHRVPIARENLSRRR